MKKHPQWFEDFLSNDWKHLNWKLNAMFIVLIVLFGVAVAKLFV